MDMQDYIKMSLRKYENKDDKNRDYLLLLLVDASPSVALTIFGSNLASTFHEKFFSF